MSVPLVAGQVIYTNKARCRDCYRCVRVCPVKAVRLSGDQASVAPERCIACGTCVRECPQGAKTFRDDTEKAARLLASGKPVAASIAPSFAALYRDWERRRLPSALRRLGFSFIGETAVGAAAVAQASREHAERNPEAGHLASACPAVVAYVERYRPEALDRLVPVCSPMVAHARLLKARLPEGTSVVFVGPCTAKKAEAERPENGGAVDCVLTFAELAAWLTRAGVDLASCEESGFDEEPPADARLYPMLGGSLKAASWDSDSLASRMVSCSGFDELEEAVRALADGAALFVEPLFCTQGCINGPALGAMKPLLERRAEALAYANSPHGGGRTLEPGPAVPLSTGFRRGAGLRAADVTEEAIERFLAETGKPKPEDRLNCGACGYASCREKAVAVLSGMAEASMCIPRMKRLAEQRTDRIIETSPNGIVILDERLCIISMNPSFRKFFACGEAVMGRHISYLMDPHRFERLVSGDADLVDCTVRHDRYNLVCREILYALPDEHQFIGIYVNITQTEQSRERLDALRAKTAQRARDLMEHQIAMAQQMAKSLGESTAQEEALVESLLDLVTETEPGEAEGDPSKTRTRRKAGWDTSTSR